MIVWGCIVYVLILDTGRDKLQSRTKRCLFVGYPKFFQGYRLFDPIDKTTIESRPMRFLEHRFDYNKYLSEKSYLWRTQ